MTLKVEYKLEITLSYIGKLICFLYPLSLGELENCKPKYTLYYQKYLVTHPNDQNPVS